MSIIFKRKHVSIYRNLLLFITCIEKLLLFDELKYNTKIINKPQPIHLSKKL